MSLKPMITVVASLLGAASLLSACSTPASPATTKTSSAIQAVGAENEYANVISQIGGRYVQVSAIESNPNTDPHTFEASPSVAREIEAAKLVVQNGLGYDTWASKIEAASPNPERKVIDVQHLLGLPDSTPNPHLWYKPTTMPAVAKAIASDLSQLEPAHAKYFQANDHAFDVSLDPWYQAIARFKAAFPSTPVAVTEPVGDYMLQASGCKILTPFSLQAAIMNGTDPSPQDVTIENNLFRDHSVKVFVYNQQVTDSLTASFLALAKQEKIPVVGVYETMPTPGYTYQSWMLAEVNALYKAVSANQSTTRL
ncbi:MAG: zinc ABC transporter substrate-binding protein [Actinobacteria bacterium]|nr:zinc ABC transporter substrate-binding protein [Actinomycetota bacterium]